MSITVYVVNEVFHFSSAITGRGRNLNFQNDFRVDYDILVMNAPPVGTEC